MKHRFTSYILTLILLSGMVAPAISEICCSEACSGGSCEAADGAMVCDPDPLGCCTTEAAVAESPATTGPATDLLGSECLPCVCFSDSEIEVFTITEKNRDQIFHPEVALPVGQLMFPAFSEIAPGCHIFPSDAPSHGPPLYVLGHSLLI